jgi:hypothetical protein
MPNDLIDKLRAILICETVKNIHYATTYVTVEKMPAVCPAMTGPASDIFFDGIVTKGDCRKFMIARLEFELSRLRGESA